MRVHFTRFKGELYQFLTASDLAETLCTGLVFLYKLPAKIFYLYNLIFTQSYHFCFFTSSTNILPGVILLAKPVDRCLSLTADVGIHGSP